MKIVIVGQGAMGSLLASFLAKTKQELWLLDKDSERSARINSRGISVEGVSGEWQVKARSTVKAEEIGEADLAIICVKSYDTKEAAMALKPAVGRETKVLTLQNGLGNVEIISEVLGGDKVIGGATNLGATMIESGKVRHAGRGETVIGRIDGKIPAEMRHIRELFNKAGLETRLSKDIKGILWSKLIVNAGINALTAITRLANGRLLEFEGTRKILREAVAEATKVAKRKRIRLIYDDPLAKTEAVCEATAGNISSMLADVLKRRRTEIDYINAAIVRQGQELGVPVPVNSMLTDLVRTIEAGYDLEIKK
jgi:2-dehydropantoate 2-reductase